VLDYSSFNIEVYFQNKIWIFKNKIKKDNFNIYNKNNKNYYILLLREVKTTTDDKKEDFNNIESIEIHNHC